ncbi:glycine cleavage system protein GcvH [Oxyplasma meridianum]|uniref:Probable glycine cleavage system H protein n=1 Tax=Oxyplasma meridianum TaxID=3073602 RepID=A0AAX4NH29_9ARCH
MSHVPNDLRYTKTHEWMKAEGTTVTVGITDFAQKQLTDIVYIDLPKEGTSKKEGEVLLTVESVKSAEDVFTPVSGEIVTVNSSLSDKPELINKDSYSNWMVKIKTTENIERKGLSPDEYRKFIGEN